MSQAVLTAKEYQDCFTHGQDMGKGCKHTNNKVLNYYNSFTKYNNSELYEYNLYITYKLYMNITIQSVITGLTAFYLLGSFMFLVYPI